MGRHCRFTVPQEDARYAADGIRAAMDAILGAVRAVLNKSYANRIFLSGLLANVALAVLLTFLGDRLGVNRAPRRGSPAGCACATTGRLSGGISCKPGYSIFQPGMV